VSGPAHPATLATRNNLDYWTGQADEVSRQLDDLGERTPEAVTTATQKVITEFDRSGEWLLGKETYWRTASGRRSVGRPDTDVVSLDVAPEEDRS